MFFYCIGEGVWILPMAKLVFPISKYVYVCISCMYVIFNCRIYSLCEGGLATSLYLGFWVCWVLVGKALDKIGLYFAFYKLIFCMEQTHKHNHYTPTDRQMSRGQGEGSEDKETQLKEFPRLRPLTPLLLHFSHPVSARYLLSSLLCKVWHYLRHL